MARWRPASRAAWRRSRGHANHPCQLSYYNTLVGGVGGAARWGLETNYWGDALTAELLDRFAVIAKPNDLAVLLPTLYSGHAIYQSRPSWRAKSLRVVPADWVFETAADVPADRVDRQPCNWALIFNRQGYLQDGLPRHALDEGILTAEVARDGIWLARLIKLLPGWVDAEPRTP